MMQRGKCNGTQRWMATAEAVGNPDQEAEDQASLFFSVPGFFPEPNAWRASLPPPMCVGGRGVLNGVVDFFLF